MGSPCAVTNRSPGELWVGLEFTGGKGCVANLLPLQKRTFCAPPDEHIKSVTIYPSKEAAHEAMPYAFITQSFEKKK